MAAFGRSTTFGASTGAFGGAAAARPFGAAAPAAAAPAVPGDAEMPYPPTGDGIQCVAWSPTAVGNLLAAGSWDSCVRVWEAPKSADGASALPGVPKAEMNVGGPVLDTQWMETGGHVFAATALKKVMLWDLAANTASEIAAHDGPIKCLAWVPEKGYLITAGWDATLRYWDPRAGTTPQATVALPERAYAMDVKGGNAMVLATADKFLHVFDLAKPTVPFRSMESPLKLQTRTVRIFHDLTYFAVGSIEGRVAIRCIDGALDDEREATNTNKLKNSFAFKCHRAGQNASLIYPINAIDTFPLAGYQDVFVTAGGDGTFTFWDKKERRINQEYKPCLQQQSISAVAFNPAGDLFAYACSYDWQKGADGKPAAPNRLMVHAMQNLDVSGPPPGAA